MRPRNRQFRVIKIRNPPLPFGIYFAHDGYPFSRPFSAARVLFGIFCDPLANSCLFNGATMFPLESTGIRVNK